MQNFLIRFYLIFSIFSFPNLTLKIFYFATKYILKFYFRCFWFRMDSLDLALDELGNSFSDRVKFIETMYQKMLFKFRGNFLQQKSFFLCQL